MIEFDRVGHAFPDSGGGATTVLRDVTVHLSEHRIGVIGANGSGKSTFARMLNALVVPSSGHVRIDGLDSAREAPKPPIPKPQAAISDPPALITSASP